MKWKILNLAKPFTLSGDNGVRMLEEGGCEIVATGRPCPLSVKDLKAELPGVDDTVIIGGRSLLDNTASSNSATIYVILKEWSERTTSETSLLGIYNAMQDKFKDYH